MAKQIYATPTSLDGSIADETGTMSSTSLAGHVPLAAGSVTKGRSGHAMSERVTHFYHRRPAPLQPAPSSSRHPRWYDRRRFLLRFSRRRRLLKEVGSW